MVPKVFCMSGNTLLDTFSSFLSLSLQLRNGRESLKHGFMYLNLSYPKAQSSEVSHKGKFRLCLL